MKKIKAFLLILLGQKQYLSLTSKLFFVYFKNGWLKNNPIYKTHYFVKNLVNEGDTVIDIGANLGYYAVQFAQLVGVAGKVYAVEPIELYRKILSKNVNPFPQVEIMPYALGETQGNIKMGNPGSDRFRHGLMRVLADSDIHAGDRVYEVPMKNPASLFGGLSVINYIKCDIEGYEVPVIPLMKSVIENHHPIMQIETDGENRVILFQFFSKLNYRMFYVDADRLQPYTSEDQLLPGDLICIPGWRMLEFEIFINKV